MDQSSRNLNGKSELTMIIPVREGVVSSVGTATYETRLRTVLSVLSGLREAFVDVSAIKPFSDVVERIQFIHSFRLAVLPGYPRKLLLAVAFDGAWEPYLRSIWRDLGPLLDVIMCNCEGYPVSTENSFECYERWIRQYQVATGFFYMHSDATVGDISYLRDSDRIQRQASCEFEKKDRLKKLKIQRAVERTRAEATKGNINLKQLEQLTFMQAANSLQALDMLRRYYRAEKDAPVLLRAAKDILKELDKNTRSQALSDHLLQFNPSLLEWFDSNLPPIKRQPSKDAAVPKASISETDLANIQGGILAPYNNCQFGALLLCRCCDMEKAREFLSLVKSWITRAHDHNALNPLAQIEPGEVLPPGAQVYVNVAFTYEGLKRLEVDQTTLNRLPEEFRMGMEKRAGILGDVDYNHPSRWELPLRNWDKTLKGRSFPLSSVDFILQIKLAVKDVPTLANDYNVEDSTHPLHALINSINGTAKKFDVDLLRAEGLVNRGRGHFGFIDGLSQPSVQNSECEQENTPKNQWSDRVAAGEIILGYTNHQDGANASFTSFTKDGTFLVLRKIKQNVNKLNAFLETRSKIQKIEPQDLKERMMGRCLDGRSLFQAEGEEPDNTFTYKRDPHGDVCPLQSHVRRSNPRSHKHMPRIMRRGMSYGPDVSKDIDEERGLMFAAYNASIACQFELIQSWLSGGNSSGIDSSAKDPFLGVARELSAKTFSCVINGHQQHFEISGPAEEGFTRLQWGAYCFVPSISTLDALTKAPTDLPAVQSSTQNHAANSAQLALNQLEALRYTAVDPVSKGTLIIKAFLDHGASDEDWKMMLEDRGAKRAGYASSIWCAIDRNFDGLLHTNTAYGVLVANKQRMYEVLNREQDFSVNVGGENCYHARMKKSVGDIYLGLDYGDEYKQESHYANQAVESIDQRSAFELAYEIAEHRFSQREHYRAVQFSIVEFLEHCLSKICQCWFDLPDDAFMRIAGMPAQASANQAHCPMHFTAPSRYIFTPTPAAFTKKSGIEHGKLLQQKALDFINSKIQCNELPSGLVSRAIFQRYLDEGQSLQCLSETQKAHIASTLVGVMFGFLPTTFGNLLTVFADWSESKNLWFLQDDYLVNQNDTELNAFENAQRVILPELEKSIAKDPTPEMIWRTAMQDTKLGDVPIKKGDKVVLSFTAITQNNGDALSTIFGGDRRNAEHPTHACPGINAAIGVMLGILSAFCAAGEWRATGSPLLLSLR